MLLGAAVIVTACAVAALDQPADPTRGQDWIAVCLAFPWAMATGVASFIAGVVGNLAANRMQAWMDWRLPDAQGFLRSQHLTSLTGNCLRVIVLSKIPAIADADRRLVQRIANALPQAWESAADDEEFHGLAEHSLARFVREPSARALGPEAWRKIVEGANGGVPPHFHDEGTLELLLDELESLFARSLREALKRDFRLGGEAAFGLMLDVAGELMRSAQDAADPSNEQTREGLVELARSAATVNTALGQLLREGHEHDRIVRERFGTIERMLRESLEIQLDTREAVRRIESQGTAVLTGVELLVDDFPSFGERINEIHAQVVRSRPSTRPTHNPPRNLPEQRNFVGREVQLADLQQRLSAQRSVGVTQQVGTFARGGVGKTQLALRYGWTHLGDYPGGVFLLNCDTPDLVPVIAALAGPLGLDAQPDQLDTAAYVRAYLETGDPMLLILDNVPTRRLWASAAWRQFLPTGETCHWLVTTREEDLENVDMKRLDRLNLEECIELLARYRDDAREPANRGAITSVVDWLGGLAVGVMVVGVYMKRYRAEVTWPNYAQQLRSKGMDIIRQTEDRARRSRNRTDDSTEVPLEYDSRIDALVDAAVDALPPAEQRALEYAALLPADQALLTWLQTLLSEDSDIEVPTNPGGVMSPSVSPLSHLVDLDLLHPASDQPHVLSLHRYLQDRAVERLQRDGTLAQRVERLVSFARTCASQSRDVVRQRDVRANLGPLLALCERMKGLGHSRGLDDIANKITSPFIQLGRYSEARRAAKLAIDIGEQSLEPDLRALASSYSNLGSALQDLGELSEAKRHLLHAIEIQEQHFGTDFPVLAVRYSNLASVLTDLDELPEAKRRILRAIEIQERHFGPNHPTVAVRYSNLATVLADLGELHEAKRRLLRAIEIQEQHLEPDHPNLADSYSNLASVLTDLGELPEARRLLLRAIEIDEQHFELNHPNLAVRCSNLALVLMALGELHEAKKCLLRAIKIQEQHLVPDHPNLAGRYANLAMVLKGLGELPEAKQHLLRAIKILEQHFELGHRDLVACHSNLAAVLRDLGELPEAKRRLLHAIEIQERHFEPDHPNLAVNYSNLATVLQDLRELPEAKRYLMRAIEVEEQRLGPNYPNLASRYSSLAVILTDLGELPEAKRCILRAESIANAPLGADHATPQ